MPWKDCTKMFLRKEFVLLAQQQAMPFTKLCERFGIKPKTGYKWLHRWEQSGEEGLQDLPRRPHSSPKKTLADAEDIVLSVKKEHPAWGGRKLRHLIVNENLLSHAPAPSTITAIIRRNGVSCDTLDQGRGPWQRFEYEAPNDLWQMDFKGKVDTVGGCCYPLTVLDDHSRFSIMVKACLNQRGEIVQESLTEAFRTYGLPCMILTDNGAPWGAGPYSKYTRLSLWLIRLGITVKHGRPYHPQTQGKDERFHKTMDVELLRYKAFKDQVHCQEELSKWRETYNMVRPHDALGGQPPISRYSPSKRCFPDQLPPIEYGSSDIVRKVQIDGTISFKGKEYHIGRVLHHYPVALRPSETDGSYGVYFCHQKVSEIDLTLG